jgi:hypothetical protein
MVQSSATTWITALGWGERVTDLNNPTLTFEEQPETVSKVNLFPVLSAPWHPRPSPGAPGLTWEEFCKLPSVSFDQKEPSHGAGSTWTAPPEGAARVPRTPDQGSWALLYGTASTGPGVVGTFVLYFQYCQHQSSICGGTWEEFASCRCACNEKRVSFDQKEPSHGAGSTWTAPPEGAARVPRVPGIK